MNEKVYGNDYYASTQPPSHLCFYYIRYTLLETVYGSGPPLSASFFPAEKNYLSQMKALQEKHLQSTDMAAVPLYYRSPKLLHGKA